ncbi:MAG: exodeoxyribonuclease VII small subunit [Verrucomicrobiae bacterium]|nr:exodeoxyribonuclease VII small subunit [Verrucomicrobiae bacterium]
MKAKAPKENKEIRFEDAMERLEKLVQEMETGDLPLEEILAKYEEGNRLVKYCAGRLNEAEKRIEILMKEKDGSLSTTPFTETEEEEPSSREKEASHDKELF